MEEEEDQTKPKTIRHPYVELVGKSQSVIETGALQRTSEGPVSLQSIVINTFCSCTLYLTRSFIQYYFLSLANILDILLH